MIETRFFEHLKSNIPGVEERVFANVMHQSTPKPALVYTVVEERPGATCEAEIDWAIHLYAESYFEAKEIKNEAVAAVKSFEPYGRDIKVSDGFDEESELYVQIITFHTGKRR